MTHRECTTHHHACDCREARFAKQLEIAREALKKIGFHEFAKPYDDYSHNTDCEEADCFRECAQIAREALERMGE